MQRRQCLKPGFLPRLRPARPSAPQSEKRNAVVGKSYQVFASEIKRVIREALLADSRITDVVDFEVVQIDKRTASVKFTAETIFGEIPIEREVGGNV